MKNLEKDILIIGGGPTGLFASLYCGLRDVSCVIVDSLPVLGGQLATLYPEKYIYDVAGFPEVRAADLVQNLIEQISPFHPEVLLNESVQEFHRLDDGTFAVQTTNNTLHVKAIVICAGIGLFQPRPLPVKEAIQYEGKGVHYFVDDLNKFKNKHILVVGGGDTALDYALMLEPVAASVSLIHRRNEFRGQEDSVKRLKTSSVTIYTPYELQELIGQEKLETVRIRNNQTEEMKDLPVDALVSGMGFAASLGPLGTWGLDIQQHEIVVNSKMETNIPGVYAAGDIVTYPGKLKLIATGFGEAPTAVNNAVTFLDPKAHLSPGHSSSREELHH